MDRLAETNFREGNKEADLKATNSTKGLAGEYHVDSLPCELR